MKIQTIMRYIFLSILMLCGLSCWHDNTQTSFFFHPISSQQSGLTFSNDINEDDKFNALDYEYLYNGGGVGIADFDLNGYPDIFFSGNMKSSRLYLNKGNWQFQDITETSGNSYL